MSFVFSSSRLTHILASPIKSLKKSRKRLPWKLCFWVSILYNSLSVRKVYILSYEIFNKQFLMSSLLETSILQNRLFTTALPFCLMGTLGECCWLPDSTTYFQQITVLKPMKSDSSKHYSVISEWKRFIFLFPLGYEGKGHAGMCEWQPHISKWFQKVVERFMFFGVKWES